jgi:hypothetical protein
MALMDYELKCVDCGSSEHTRIKMVLTKNRIVQFHVMCHSETCNGNFSHQLPYSDINRAVKQFLENIAGKAMDLAVKETRETIERLKLKGD